MGLALSSMGKHIVINLRSKAEDGFVQQIRPLKVTVSDEAGGRKERLARKACKSGPLVKNKRIFI